MPNGIACLLGLLPRFWLSMGPSMLPSQIVPKMLANRLEGSFTKLLATNFWQSTHEYKPNVPCNPALRMTFVGTHV